MRLEVHWINATRPPEEKIRVEALYAGAVLEFYKGSVENAKHSYETYKKHPRHPFHDWPRSHYFAFQAAARGLSPWEKTHAKITTEFTP